MEEVNKGGLIGRVSGEGGWRGWVGTDGVFGLTPRGEKVSERKGWMEGVS